MHTLHAPAHAPVRTLARVHTYTRATFSHTRAYACVPRTAPSTHTGLLPQHRRPTPCLTRHKPHDTHARTRTHPARTHKRRAPPVPRTRAPPREARARDGPRLARTPPWSGRAALLRTRCAQRRQTRRAAHGCPTPEAPARRASRREQACRLRARVCVSRAAGRACMCVCCVRVCMTQPRA
jgi:hypothetical protein